LQGAGPARERPIRAGARRPGPFGRCLSGAWPSDRRSGRWWPARGAADLLAEPSDRPRAARGEAAWW